MFSTSKKYFTVISTCLALLLASPASQGADLGPSADYIISVTEEARPALAISLRTMGLTVDDTFENAIDGFLLSIPEALVSQVRALSGVKSLELDLPMSLFAQEYQSPTPSWGLDRIDQRTSVATSDSYTASFGYNSAGAGATIYIGDTGISAHDDLAGRISQVGFTGFNDGYGPLDCNGHGTHVATTAAGTNYGVAKRATVVPIKLLNCAGSGSYSTVIAGLDWILSDQNTNQKAGSVLNLSIGGGFSPAQ